MKNSGQCKLTEGIPPNPLYIRTRYAELDYSSEFYGNSRLIETGLYYDISGYRHPAPSPEAK